MYLSIKNRLSGIVLTLLFAMEVGLAQSKVVWQNGKEFDFGSIESGATHTTIFHFKNMSTDTLTIETVRTTCGCTAAHHTLEPVPPQGNGTVEVAFHSESKRGFHKKIMVFFDRQKKAEVLHIRGEVE